MNKKQIIAAALTATLALPLAACGGSSSSSTTSTGSTTSSSTSTTSSSSSEKDASYYAGTWRGSVATTGTSVYGTTGGSEQMLDVILNEDGTCETKPCKNHEDLVTDTGTWELDGTTVKLQTGTIAVCCPRLSPDYEGNAIYQVWYICNRGDKQVVFGE